MFVRIVWGNPKRFGISKPGLRRIAAAPRSSLADLGVKGPDFACMTKGLFERPE